jgi:hypothetical protein
MCHFFAHVEKARQTRRKEDNGTARDPSKDEVFFLSFRSGLLSCNPNFARIITVIIERPTF